MPELLAFTAEHVCRLTGLSARQLRYWDATEFFSPEILDDHHRRAFGRIYSFRDLVGLRAIAVLRNHHRVPLQELRKVGEWLLSHHETPWSSLRFALSGGKVAFAEPGTNMWMEAKGGGQTVRERPATGGNARPCHCSRRRPDVRHRGHMGSRLRKDCKTRT